MRLTILLLLPFFAFSQSRTILHGKITADLTELDGIHVINIQTDNAVLTQSGGYFDIPAKPGDTLMFTAYQFQGRRVVLAPDDFGQPVWFVRLEGMINQLEEVKIQRYNSISAEALGIIPRGVKSYTPAERKLRTASAMAGIGPMASLDPLINWLTGRTAMLKKEVEVERKELFKARLSDLFEADYFTQTLKIPAIYVEDFLFFISANRPLEQAIKAKNRPMSTFLLGELAEEYKKLVPQG